MESNTTTGSFQAGITKLIVVRRPLHFTAPPLKISLFFYSL